MKDVKDEHSESDRSLHTTWPSRGANVKVISDAATHIVVYGRSVRSGRREASRFG